jgi:hypothetical protein
MASDTINTPVQPARRLGRFGAVDPAAVAKAQAALESLSSQFGQWMQEELDKLAAARTAISVEGWSDATAEQLYFRAHDLKGLGTTYGYPTVTRLAASLCRLLDDPAGRLRAPMALVDAHADAIVAVVRDEIRDVDSPSAKVLLPLLEASVADRLAA